MGRMHAPGTQVCTHAWTCAAGADRQARTGSHAHRPGAYRPGVCPRAEADGSTRAQVDGSTPRSAAMPRPSSATEGIQEAITGDPISRSPPARTESKHEIFRKFARPESRPSQPKFRRYFLENRLRPNVRKKSRNPGKGQVSAGGAGRERGPERGQGRGSAEGDQERVSETRAVPRSWR